MTHRSTVSLAQCPYCNAYSGNIQLNRDEIPKYAAHRPVLIRENPRQGLILSGFDADARSFEPCPHTLQLAVCVTSSTIADGLTEPNTWSLDIGWWHERMDGPNNPLMHFLFRELEGEMQNEPRFPKLIEHTVDLRWGHSGQRNMCTCFGTVVFAESIVSLPKIP